MTTIPDPAQLTARLIRCASVTPDEGGALVLLADLLGAAGFECHRVDREGVPNLFARWGAKGARTFGFNGHTDVVPPGDPVSWTHPPFSGHEAEGWIWGRGATDMKSGVAAFAAAAIGFVTETPPPDGAVILAITGDEEGPGKHGTRALLDWMAANGERMDVCIVGEPSSTSLLGDVVKNGRRGSLGCTLTVRGKQGHVAYPHLARNPIHLAAPALAELAAEHWDNGNAYFPPTSFQISNLNSGTGATNVIPGELKAVFNFRFSTESTVEGLQQRVSAILDKHGLDYSLDWALSGLPFLTQPGELLDAVAASIQAVTGRATTPSTSGGTSDGRFIATLGTQVVELGPVNATIHQINERVLASDLDLLTEVYYQTLVKLLA